MICLTNLYCVYRPSFGNSANKVDEYQSSRLGIRHECRLYINRNLLLACVQLSDWESLSKKIQKQMAANPHDFESDSDESSLHLHVQTAPRWITLSRKRKMKTRRTNRVV